LTKTPFIDMFPFGGLSPPKPPLATGVAPTTIAVGQQLLQWCSMQQAAWQNVFSETL